MNITTPIVISQTGVKLSLNEKNIISTVDAIEVNGGSLTINGKGNVKAGIEGLNAFARPLTCIAHHI